MSKKTVGHAALVLAGLVLAYLGAAALWAYVAFDDVMARAPVADARPLSARQAAILLQIEDPTFYTHRGLSLAPGQGVATLSSALVRTLYLSDRQLDGAEGVFQRIYRGAFDCCKAFDVGRDAMALVLDARLAKRSQLALYVASVYMGTSAGTQVHGLAQAAHSYLGKPLAALTEAEFIGLVAMIKAPNQFHPQRHPREYALRTARVAAVVAGTCRPGGWFDTAYAHCAPAL